MGLGSGDMSDGMCPRRTTDSGSRAAKAKLS
jgi:hypothetical protein